MRPEATLILEPATKVPESGDLVNGYLLGRLLGRGANGSVYHATRVRDNRAFAIKIISLDGRSEAFVERVIRECSITTKLRHPGIMSVHEADYWGAALYIVMDIATGVSADQFEDGRLGWERVVEITRRVAQALNSAYGSARIIHRDIKPANIMVDLADDRLRSVKVVDFGLSRSVDEGGSDLTMTGMILGTPFYMSPEQAQGERNLGFQTDLYALGATLFHLVAGQPPFPKGSPVEILLQHCRKEPPVLHQVRRDCPVELSEVVACCLAKRPEQRFPSYQAFIAALVSTQGKTPFDANPFDLDEPQDLHRPLTTRHVHRAITAPPPQADAPGDGSGSRGSTSSEVAEALGDLFRAKITETSRIYQRKNGLEAKSTTTPATALPSLTPRFKVPQVGTPPKKTSRWSDEPVLSPVIVEEEPPEEEKEEKPRFPPTLKPGTMIDTSFVITNPIGSGAMGEVYAVEDTLTKRQLALKVLFLEDMNRAGIVLRFQSEAQALATVDHPAFPYFAGKGVIEGRDYLMMERVSGVDVKSWLKAQGGRTSEAKALHILLQLGQAMHRANALCGMVHRDIKPANLMITDAEELTLKIIDFGVSTYINYGDFEDFSHQEYKYIDDDSLGKAVGSPAYMSPEQCLGKSPSPSMDIYAIGCTFHQLLTGRTPFKARNSGHMMMKHLHDPPPLFDESLGVTSGSAYILARCLAKKPEERFRNYKQLEDAVNAAIFQVNARTKKTPSDQHRAL